MARLIAVWTVLVLIASGCGGNGDSTGGDSSAELTATTVADSPDQTAPSSPTTEPAAPESTVSTESTAAPDTVLPVTGWERFENGIPLWPSEIIVVNDEFFAIGSAQIPGVQRSGVWRSTDGISWTESLIFTQSGPSDQRVQLGEIAVVGDEIVTLAQRTEGPPWPFATNREFVAFASGDGGLSWSETVIDQWGGPYFRDWPFEAAFAQGDPSVVFAVEGGSDTDERSAITGTLIWIRTDKGWTYVDPADSGLSEAWVCAMTAIDGGFVALADDRVQLEGFADCQTQALWHSPDAKGWTKVWQDPTDCQWFSTRYMFTLDGALYALGNENDVASCTVGDDGSFDCPMVEPAVRLFRITDEAIEDVETEPFEFTQMFLSDLAVNEGVFVAIGRTYDEREARIWVSADARTWTAADIPAEELVDEFPFQVAALDGTVIALATEIVPPVGPTNFHTWLIATE